MAPARFRMKSPRTIAAQFQFSTDRLLARERLPAWRDVLNRTIARLDVEPLDRGAFHCEATVCQLPTLGVLSATSSAVQVSHTPHSIAGDDLLFVAAPSSTWSVAQLGRTLELHPGDGVLLVNDAAWSLTF